MIKNYYLNYFNAINNASKNSKFLINQNKTEPEEFFYEIKKGLEKIRDSRRKLFFLGNGASSAFANHMALDFSKNGKILSRSMSDSALLTALSNDYSYTTAMLEYLKMEEVTGEDLVITISSSGNSPNIVKVLEYCKENCISSLALSGLKSDNKSMELASYSIYVPMKTYGIVECVHQIYLHLILDELMGIYEWDRDEFQNMNHNHFKI
jgi:D-sedoheptulose 7-phosphate isomerase